MHKRIIAIYILLMLFLNLSMTASAQGVAPEDEKGATPSGIPVSELENFIDGYVQDYIGVTAAGASIVVIKDNRVLFSKGYGYADIENRIPVESHTTVFEWGSISKLLVWTSVMQMGEEGKIDLQADIRTYLPEGFLTKLTYAEPITMLHLMNHNAGFEDNIFDLCYPSPEYVVSLEDGLKRAEPAQVYHPGKVVAYSNYSTSLAAYIIERISGKDFYQYVSDNIFVKLGMGRSSGHPTLADKPELLADKAQGYVLGENGEFILSSWNYMSLYPSGGINGMAPDLAAFAMALMPPAGQQSPLFEKEDTLARMFSQSYTPNENMLDIAHGFWEYRGAKRGLTHGGNTIAFSSNFHIVPEEGFAVIVLTNQTGELDLCYGLTTALVGGKISPAAGADLPDSKKLEGVYMSARSPHHGFLSVYPYLTGLVQVTSTGQNTIRLSLAGLTADYVQTSPYIYEKSDGHVLFDMNRQLHFQVGEGRVHKISSSITDFLPLPEGRTMPFLIGYAVAGALCAAYFSVMLLVMPVGRMVSRRKDRPLPAGRFVRRYTALINLTGAALLANNLLLLARMLMNADRAYSEIQIHFLVNYGLTVGAFVFIGVLFLHRKEVRSMKRRGFFSIISSALLLLLIGLLINWQFYS